MRSSFPFLRRLGAMTVGVLGLHLASSVGAAAVDPTAKPDLNRFSPVVLAQGSLDEPMVFEVLKDGRVYIAERRGALNIPEPST